MSARLPDFDWRVYADATSAGLSVLIPLPLLDLAFERLFRRRMPGAICRARGANADPRALALLRKGEPWLTTGGCLLAPVMLSFYLLKRFSRKLLYVLTIHEAGNALSVYWHRAYLIDYAARAGHLALGQPIDHALAAFDRALSEANTGALGHLARQTTLGARHVFRTLWRARRRGAEGEFPAQAALLAGQWDTIAGHLGALVARYEALRAPSAPAADPNERPTGAAVQSPPTSDL
jgi:hypothetical protein